MKIKTIALQILIILYFCSYVKSQDIRLMTYNIRYANESDFPHVWEARNPLILAQIHDFKPDIAGFQEVLHRQLIDLENGMKNYQRIGVGRDDGATAGEYAPLFINTERFKILDNGVFWLSENPEKVSVGWDAALPRIATWATLYDHESNENYLVINTHFDHVGKLARFNSIQLIVDFLKKPEYSDYHAVLMGDLNTGPEEEPYEYLKKHQLLIDPYFDALHRKGPADTFNDFKYESKEDRIDYIFLDRKLKALKYEVLMEMHNGILPSDHWPVMVIARKR
ncbi:MAG TPA: endonuclease/exonuclease/phosphatase family protein [Bacteroidales bacterium]|nr:endonuclease/exonuclease/phosphatase family protein [Bacteroidales bacterium]